MIYRLKQRDTSKVFVISSSDRVRNNGFKLEKFRHKKEIGSLMEWLMNGTKSVIRLLELQSVGSFKRLYKYMDVDDRWNR